MIRIFKTILVFSTLIIVVSCGKKKDLQPEQAVLLFPEQNSECTTGKSIDENYSVVTFKWQAASNTDQYRLYISNLFDNTVQQLTSVNTSMQVTLKKRTPYAWQIFSLSNSISVTASSEEWRFYNAAEGVTNYAPFPAEIIHPKSGATAVVDQNGQVILEWNTTDVDGDLDYYTVYLDTNNPPTTEVASNLAAKSVKAALLRNTLYYWMVESVDLKGNSSNSGIYQFKTK